MKKKDTVLSVLQDIRRNTQPGVVNKMAGTGRFIKNLDGTVTDKLLNLTWGKTLPERMTWENAKSECEKICYRLPTAHELHSLVDYTKHAPAIDKEIFPDTKTDDWYWTSTPCAWDQGLAWMVGFGSGHVYSYGKGGSNYVRPVRSSQ